METKRPNVQVAAATPVPKAGIASKTNVGKTVSEASMTPSQLAAEAAKARKHPLDALSRSVINRGMEKRSGLQDVDDDFLKQNFFARQGYGRHSGLNDGNLYTTNMKNTHAAGQPSGMAQNAMQQQMASNLVPESTPQMQFVAGQTMSNAQHPQQMQQMQQPMQQTMQQPMQQTMQQPMQQPMQQTMQQQPQMHQNPMQQQQLPQQSVQNQVPVSPAMPATMPAAGQPSGMPNTMPQMHTQPQHIPTPHSQQPQMQTSPSQHMHQVPATPSQTNSVPQNIPQQQQVPVPPQAAPMSAQQPAHVPTPQPEPDMCTTCPNCQTTIYLVRPDAPELQQMQQIQQAVN